MKKTEAIREKKTSTLWRSLAALQKSLILPDVVITCGAGPQRGGVG